MKISPAATEVIQSRPRIINIRRFHHRPGVLYRLDFLSGKSYIGITEKTGYGRYKGHQLAAKSGNQCIVYRAWRKYGRPKLVILAILEKHMLQDAEKKAISVFKTKSPNGYNMTFGGDTSPATIPEIAAKISKSKQGKVYSSEHCAAISASLQGRSLSPSHRAHISTSGKGKRRSAKTCANIRATWDDPDVYLARCAASSAAQCRPEVRAKKSKAMRGQKRTKEQIANMREAQNRPDVRLKKSLSTRGRKPSAATLAGIQRAKLKRQSQHGGLFA